MRAPINDCRNTFGSSLVSSPLRVACAAVLLCGLTGCLNEMIALGYLIGGPPSIEPDFDRMTEQSMTDHEVTAAVVCFAPSHVQWNFPEIHHQIAKFVALRLAQHEIHVANPDSVRAWLDENDNWDKPEDIGAALGVTYVIYVDLHTFNLYEENSSNLFRGQAEAVIGVTKIDESGDGEKIYSKEITSKYPLSVPRSTYEVSYETFMRQYLSRLSEEIGRLFYEYYNGDDIPDAA